MARSRRFLVRMILFLVAVLVVLAVLFPQLQAAFMANVPLNGLILGVLLLGIIYNFRQVTMLNPEIAWIESFRYNQPTLSQPKAPKLLAPMATMLGERKDRLSLSALSMRSLLDGIQARLDESRDISRYIIGLLIFLGLLGTFWGLLDTVASIRGVISSLSIASGDASTVFRDLKSGLNAPLSGMGTAFSSSLFGLGGSLVLGFLDLQGGQAQNHFFNQLEDWLSSLTRLSSGVLPGDGDQGVPAYVQALLEQTAESLENLQITLARGEEGRISSTTNMVVLVEKLGTLTDHMQTEQALMIQLAESQTELKNILARLADRVGHSAAGMDEATRTHIRNLDVYVARLLEELSTGRDDIIHQVRNEIKLLARTIAAIAEEAER
ncbi:MAG: flagellar motor protein MotA [Rhodospirillales bacterium]